MFGLDTFGTGLFCLGLLGTLIYAIKMFLMVALGIGDDDIMDIDVEGIDLTADVDLGDVDVDVDVDIDSDSDSSFTWLSINTVTSFMMLFGWFGLATYEFLYNEEYLPIFNLLGQLVSVVVGTGVGVLGVKLNFWVIKQIAKFKHSGTMSKVNLVGQQGTVYIRISPNNDGAILIKADNQTVMEITATTKGKEVIQPDTEVKVIAVENGKLVIEPVKEGV